MARKSEKMNGPRMFCEEVDESLPPFVVNLWNLVNHHNLWTSGGRAFHIPNEAVFESALLPKYYKHCKLASFVRQLNMYNFEKQLDAAVPTWRHPAFLQHRPQGLPLVKRKPTATAANHSSASSAAAPAPMHEEHDNEELLLRIEELEARQQEAAKKIWNLEQNRLRLESQLAQDQETKLALQSSLEQTRENLAALSAVLLSQNQMSAPDEPCTEQDVAMDDHKLKMEACLTPVALPTSWDLLVPPTWPVLDDETSTPRAALPASCLIHQEERWDIAIPEHGHKRPSCSPPTSPSLRFSFSPPASRSSSPPQRRRKLDQSAQSASWMQPSKMDDETVSTESDVAMQQAFLFTYSQALQAATHMALGGMLAATQSQWAIASNSCAPTQFI